MDCPNCGGECYDNLARKAQGKMKSNGPDFACKDKDGCGWKKWPPRGQKAPSGGNGGNAPSSSREKWTWGDLFAAYEHCSKHARKMLGHEASNETIQSATATLLIAAKDHNLAGPDTLKKRAAAPKTAPPPPPPPVQEDTYEGYPTGDDLPF